MIGVCKELNMSSQKMDDTADCLGICLKKLFDFYGFYGFERIFQYGCKMLYIKEENNNARVALGTFDIYFPNYFSLAEIYYNVQLKVLEKVDSSLIITMIDEQNPVLISLPINEVPWAAHNNVNLEERHYFIVIGYNKEKLIYICIDPYYFNEKIDVPFKLLDDYNSNLVNLLRNEPTIKYVQKCIDYDMKHFRESNTLGTSYKSLISAYSLMQSNLQYLDGENIFLCLISEKELYYINLRYARCHGFFKFLNDNYSYGWLRKIMDIYNEKYWTSKLLIKLFVKYSLTANTDIINKIMKIVLDFIEAEKQIETILGEEVKMKI